MCEKLVTICLPKFTEISKRVVLAVCNVGLYENVILFTSFVPFHSTKLHILIENNFLIYFLNKSLSVSCRTRIVTPILQQNRSVAAVYM